MAIRIVRPAVLLTAEDCMVLDAMLTVAVKELKRRDQRMPELAKQIVASINRTADQFRANAEVNAESETVFDRHGFATRPSTASEVLSVQDVAQMAGVSEQFVRSLAREGTLTGVQSGNRGPWKLTRSSVDLWMAARSNTKAA